MSNDSRRNTPQDKPRLVAFRADADLYRRLVDYAQKNDRSISWVVREAVRRFLRRNGSAA